MLVDLLLASALALSAALIALQAASMLIRQGDAAKGHRDEAYAFAALVEEVIGGPRTGLVEGEEGWRAEVEPSGSSGSYAPGLVRITNTRGGEDAPFVWESWRGSGR